MDLFYNEKKNFYRSPTESNPSLFQLTRLQIDSESKHQQKEQFHHGRWVTALLGRTKRKLNLNLNICNHFAAINMKTNNKMITV